MSNEAVVFVVVKSLLGLLILEICDFKYLRHLGTYVQKYMKYSGAYVLEILKELDALLNMLGSEMKFLIILATIYLVFTAIF